MSWFLIEQKNKFWNFFFVLERKNHYGENSFRDFRKVLMSSTKKVFQILHVWVIFEILRLFVKIFWNGTWRGHLGQLTKLEFWSFWILRLVFTLGTTPWCILRTVTLISFTSNYLIFPNEHLYISYIFYIWYSGVTVCVGIQFPTRIRRNEE